MITEIIFGGTIAFITGFIFFNRYNFHGPNSNVEKRIVRYNPVIKKYYTMEPRLKICPSNNRGNRGK